jgi:DNA-binding response OmpR family regulator
LGAALIVDGDPDTRQMYAAHLRVAHFDVDEAEEGRQALAKALGHHFDVIVMDTRLPGINGYQLAQVLRRDPSTRTVPIVVVTSEGASSAVDRAWKAGANAVIVKPAMPDMVLAEIQQLLEAPTAPAPRTGDARQPPVVARSGRVQSRAHQRGDTLEPPIQPPELVCPECDTLLAYRRSHVGGVSAKHSEQWDDYECPKGCGTFQYRQRTRKTRRC